MHWIALPLPHWGNEGAEGPSLAGADADAAGWWALRFTPRVALVDGEAVLLEVSSTERLWGGRDALLAQVCAAWVQAARGAETKGEGAEGAGNVVPGGAGRPPCAGRGDGDGDGDGEASSQPPLVWGCGPTAPVAQALLRMAMARRPLPARVPEGLPLHTLTALRPHVGSLERMGCRTWGALQALPRAGVGRRFGAAVLQAIDQALGRASQAHRWIELPAQFALATELPALAESADALLWSASRALVALQGWLQARQLGALRFELAWRHDLRRIDGVTLPAGQTLQVRTAQPTQDMAHLRRLLAENLGRTTLAAPANQITLRLVEAAPLPHRSASLLPPGEWGDGNAAPAGEALHQLLERLSARLGASQVQAPVLQADHRPECMQQWRPAAEVLGTRVGSPPGGPHAPDSVLWPTWLLRTPQRLAVQGHRPCHHGLLRLLAGPHRFESGWWSCADAAAPGDPAGGPGPRPAQRDYFIAHNDVAGLVWVYRERVAPPVSEGATGAGLPCWFLHGLFG